MSKSNFLLLFILVGSMAIQANSNAEALIKAVNDDDIASVRQLLQTGTDVNATDNYDLTALMYAAHKGNLDMIKLLLEVGADVNAVSHSEDDFDVTPLKAAIVAENLPAVQLLLDSGADANRLDSKIDGTVLMAALRERAPLEIIKLLIDKGALIQAHGRDGNTPLMSAVQSGRLEAVKLLIEKGAPINAKDNYGSTALSVAKDTSNFLNRNRNVGTSEIEQIISLLEKKGAK